MNTAPPNNQLQRMPTRRKTVVRVSVWMYVFVLVSNVHSGTADHYVGRLMRKKLLRELRQEKLDHLLHLIRCFLKLYPRSNNRVFKEVAKITGNSTASQQPNRADCGKPRPLRSAREVKTGRDNADNSQA